MALYLASYDIQEEHHDEYANLWNYFDSLKAVRVLLSEYAVPFTGKAVDLANAINPHLRKGDRLLVCELFNGTGGTCSWVNLKISDDELRKLLADFARTLN